MKKNFIFFLIFALFVLPLLAIGEPVNVVGKHVSVRSEAGGTVSLQTQSTDDVKVQTNNTDRWKVDGTTGDLKPSANTYDIVRSPAVATPATAHPTPGAAGEITSTYSRLVAGSPTLAYVQMPYATAAVGKDYKITNEGSYPVLIAGKGADTVNAAAANTPYSCASGKTCDCTAPATGLWKCGSK